ncbi:SDR family oxidoreductase [Vibrio hannami]|uniref:SDR family oxidoreductase n=1 Tax=Vibrio hannami TaxID=2717094 RepID=UPI00240EF613|nr:SDR family oxidoreductase [Vibrio hannami]MDG3088556.1 SDR family oxidoreductase [Vibrio hannami]
MPTLFITGANRGIGFEFVKQYAHMSWNIIACFRNHKSAKELVKLSEHYPNITLHQLDVSDEKQIHSLTSKFSGKPIDVLIHNAGVDGATCEELGSLTQKNLQDVFMVNTVSPVLITQALLSNLLIGTYKTIAGLTSILSSIDDNHSGGRLGYRTSKAALNQTIKTLASDLSELKIKALAIHPGWVKTSMGGMMPKSHLK